MAETLSNISTISFIAVLVFTVLAIVQWFFFKIPTVIGDLSGRNAKKSIELLRKNNEKTGNKSYRTSSVNVARGKLTETIETKKKKDRLADLGYVTGILNENKARTYQGEVTSMLNDNESTGILIDKYETAPLETNEKVRTARKSGGIRLTMIDEVIYVHTKEII